MICYRWLMYCIPAHWSLTRYITYAETGRVGRSRVGCGWRITFKLLIFKKNCATTAENTNKNSSTAWYCNINKYNIISNSNSISKQKHLRQPADNDNDDSNNNNNNNNIINTSTFVSKSFNKSAKSYLLLLTFQSIIGHMDMDMIIDAALFLWSKCKIQFQRVVSSSMEGCKYVLNDTQSTKVN